MAQAVSVCDLVQPEVSTLASTIPKDTSRHLCLPSSELVCRLHSNADACVPH